MQPPNFSSTTIDRHLRQADIKAILTAAIRAVDPAEAVRRSLQRQDDRLIAGNRSYALGEIGRIFIVGAGKAAGPMGLAAAQIIGDRLTAGLLITKDGHSEPALDSIGQIEAAHPIPDTRGAGGAEKMLGLLRTTGNSDLVICLISGGGSALLTAPAAGTNLDDLQSLTGQLLASGADIKQINAVRKHLSRVKGGLLARAAFPARTITLILSDVVGDDLDAIASGPTVPDSSSFADAVQVLEHYEIPVPEQLQEGAAGRRAENPKPGDPIFDRVHNLLIGTNRLAAEAALAEAGRRGLSPTLLTDRLEGEARQAGMDLAGKLTGMPPNACWIAGGETTVTLGENPGKGGRNQELALAAVPVLAGRGKNLLISLATDGGDGLTDAAGAVVSGHTSERAVRRGMQPADFLERHDSYHFFQPLGDLIKTGPTKTNVNDLVFLFSFESP